MIGSFITRGLVLIFGYAYPAYECFKTVEMNKPEIEKLRFWCQYWILVAGLTVCERISDVLISWVPMYGEAKLAFFIYLWYPKTKGTKHVYDSFFQPYVAKHESEIDRNLLELKSRTGDLMIFYWQKGVSYCRTIMFNILHFVAAQSSLPHAAQPQQGSHDKNPVTESNHRSHVPDKQPPLSSPSSPSSTSSSESQENTEEEDAAWSSEPSKPETTPASALSKNDTSKVSISSTEEQPMDIHPTENENIQVQDKVLKDTERVTRARSRKTAPPVSTGSPSKANNIQ